MVADCRVFVKSSWVDAEFVGVFQKSILIEPSLSIGGHPGGNVAYPVVVVKLDGKFQEFRLTDVRYTDNDGSSYEISNTKY